MANEFIKYAFTAGEISPKLYGRTDLQQYDLGLAMAQNWFVDYRGGISNRAGFEFLEFLMNDDKNFKLFSFNFSPRASNKYVLIFGENYLRFAQQGSYVLEAAKTVTDIAGNGVVTSVAHGFTGGDWIKLYDVVGPTNLNNRTFQISNVTANTFRLKTVPAINPITLDSAYVSGGTVQRIYTVPTAYAGSDLAKLKLKQQRDYIRMTHPDFNVKNLVRNGQTNWTISNENFGVQQAAPTGLVATPSTAGTAAVLFTVTAVLRDDQETVMAVPYIVRLIGDYVINPESITFNWDVHPNAVSYNVYRSAVVIDSAALTRGVEMGFIGNVIGTQLVDSNIVPDYKKTPPLNNNPFAAQAIDTIVVTNGGAAYDDTTTFTISDPDGTGFIGFPIISEAGLVTAIGIIKRGKGYSAPVGVFGGAGAGAAVTITTTPATGNNPTVSATFQQKQIYAASDQDPLGIWGSKAKMPSNFDYSKITIASDSYQFDVDAPRLAPILHLEAVRGGLIVMSEDQIWQLTGGSETAVTALNALADPQTYTGVSDVEPLRIKDDLYYVESHGFGVYALTYNEYAKVYSSDDKSLISSHLFKPDREIIAWASCPTPLRMAYVIQENGALLAFTISKSGKDDSINAWTPLSTRGLFECVTSLYENNYDIPYVVVKRYINGRWTKYFERMRNRANEALIQSFFVDSGLRNSPNFMDGDLTADASTGEGVRFTAELSSFPVGCEGWVIHAGGGLAEIVTRLDAFSVLANITLDFTDVLPEDANNTPLPISTWSLDEPFSELSGLWHLEGETIVALYDGNVAKNLLVENGRITLPGSGTRITAGLPYTAIARTLPPAVSNAVIEGRKKRVMSAVTRVNLSKGLRYGTSLDKLYIAKERTGEAWDQATQLFSGQQPMSIAPQWEINTSMYFVQSEPLPVTILGLVTHEEIGDDSD